VYIPKPFETLDQVAQMQFIEKNSFGHLLSISGKSILSTPMPFLLSEGHKCLFGHVAKVNPHWKELNDQDVTILIQSEHDYISPSWYKDSGVPTWNYQVVNIYGKVKIIDDSDQLEWIVNTLTKKYEN
jgi:transcriptional regulator